jgi:hypothetical protein
MKKPVCVDVDGVLCRYDGFKGIDYYGPVLDGAVEFTHKLGERYYVIIYTSRTWEGVHPPEKPCLLANRVREWLDANGFFYDEVYTGAGKPFAKLYIDDRAARCRPQEDPDAYEKVFEILNQEDFSGDIDPSESKFHKDH